MNQAAPVKRARARFLNQALQLEEPRPARLIGTAILVTTSLLCGAIAWASVTRIDEIAHAPGEIVPAGHIHDIQHLEGGIVAAIHVRNGDTVAPGQPLIELAPSTTRAEYQRLLARVASLSLEAERLQALRDEREPDFGPLAADYPELSAQQRAILTAQRAQLETELSRLDARIHQRESELQRQRNQARAIRAEIRLLREQVGIRRTLAEQNLVSKTELLSTQSQLAATLSEQRDILDGIAVAEAALREAREQREERLRTFRRDIALEAGTVESRLAETRHALAEARDKAQRLVIRSRIQGIVQELAVTSVNAVIEPGQVIMRIVPVGDELIVEARVDPRDIGHVHPGQSADIRLAAYDSSRFGSVPGKLLRLSATTYLDDRHQPYYRAEIQLQRDYMGAPSDGLRILPGMTATANIRTGDKTLMAYLIRPVSRGLSNAFVER